MNGPAMQSMVDKAALHAQLPIGRDHASKLTRHKLFSRFDPNGNGILSLAEVDRGLKVILQVAGIGDCTLAINRAFHAARDVAPPVASFSDDYIDKNEFRVLFVYLRHYVELFEIFSSIDTSGDRRVRLQEFQAALPLLSRWGLKAVAAWERNPRAAFAQMDTNDGGVVLFDEFADFVLRNGLRDLDGDDSQDRKEALEELMQQKPNLTTKNLPQMRDLNFGQAPATSRDISSQNFRQAPATSRDISLQSPGKPWHQVTGMNSGAQSARGPPKPTMEPMPMGVNQALGAAAPNTGQTLTKWDTTYKRTFKMPADSRSPRGFVSTMASPGKLAVRSKLDQQMAMYSTGQLRQMLAHTDNI